jgi:hypothetical protein
MALSKSFFSIIDFEKSLELCAVVVFIPDFQTGRQADSLGKSHHAFDRAYYEL